MKETSGSLTATTVAIPADQGRDGLLISNNSDTAMTYRPLGTATAAIGIAVPAGQAINIGDVLGKAVARGAGTLFCAGTSKAYSFYET